jgi:malonyl CoA-acyl carrier protein transacylase
LSVGFIFPAFVSEYSGNEPEDIRKYSDGFDNLLDQACVHTEINLKEFVLHIRNVPDHELNAQLISYVFSCAIADLLKENNLVPQYLAGYSMGLYAALYSGKSISFTQGMDLVIEAYKLINASIPNAETGMGSIVGLTKEDIVNLLAKYEGVFLANTNGKHAFLISGVKPVIQTVLRDAKLEGALHTSLMNVKSPYHTPF